MTKLSELNDLVSAARNLQDHDRRIVEGITYSINKLSELRAGIEREVNKRTLVISELDKEAEKHRL